jgi:HPt (histidine-containing phosphotransfer) domain-containing protein
MDGLETARQICKRWPPERRPRIIAMTGNALMGDREKCIAAGMDDYISKPVRVGELQAAIEHWGPLSTRKSDTNFISKYKSISLENLLDPTIIAELREMPPTDGVSMLKELIDLFLDGAPQRITQIVQAATDPPNLAFHAHALKSMSLNLGAKRIIEISQKLEELGRAGKAEGVGPLLQDLQTAFTLTKAQLLPLREG